MAEINYVGILYVMILASIDGLIIWRARMIIKNVGWKTIWSYFIAGILVSLVGILVAIAVSVIPTKPDTLMVPAALVWFGSTIVSTLLAFVFVYKFSKAFKKQMS